MGKRARSRAPAARSAAPPPVRRRRRHVLAPALIFGGAGVVALLLPHPGAELLGLLGVGAAAFGGGRLARALGLPAAGGAGPGAGVGFGLVVAGRALLGLPPFAGVVLSGLAAAALTGLLVPVALTAPAPATAQATRLAARLRRGHLGRLVGTVALGSLALRALLVAVATGDDASWGVVLLPGLAAALLWPRRTPAGGRLAALILGLIPGLLALGSVTDFALWGPVTHPLATALAAVPPRVAPILAGSLGATVGYLAVILVVAGPPPAAAAPSGTAAARTPA